MIDLHSKCGDFNSDKNHSRKFQTFLIFANRFGDVN